jgi:hypothetical protein
VMMAVASGKLGVAGDDVHGAPMVAWGWWGPVLWLGGSEGMTDHNGGGEPWR